MLFRSGLTIDGTKKSLLHVISGYKQLAIENKTDLFHDIPPAPKSFWNRFRDANALMYTFIVPASEGFEEIICNYIVLFGAK